MTVLETRLRIYIEAWRALIQASPSFERGMTVRYRPESRDSNAVCSKREAHVAVKCPSARYVCRNTLLSPLHISRQGGCSLTIVLCMLLVLLGDGVFSPRIGNSGPQSRMDDACGS